jgi:hypothetical protein
MNSNPNLNRYFGSKGFALVTDTSAHVKNFYGITILTAAVISAMAAPTTLSPEAVAYAFDTGIATASLPVGFYPIRGSSITFTSGTAILWLE